jgi:hypothetical protein
MLTISLWIVFGFISLALAPLTHSIVSHCFFLPNIAINGGTYDEIAGIDLGQCCIRCAQVSIYFYISNWKF